MRLLSRPRKYMAIAVLLFVTACHGAGPGPSSRDMRAELDRMARETVARGAMAEDRRPAFSQTTVLKLNSIMKESKDALDQFDIILPEYRRAVKSRDTAAVDLLRGQIEIQLERSIRAHSAFQAEKAAIEASGEYFDKIILETMATFVAEAPAEISAALAS